MILKLTDRTTMDYLSNEFAQVQDRIREVYKDETKPLSVKGHELNYLVNKENYIITQMALIKQIITPSIN